MTSGIEGGLGDSGSTESFDKKGVEDSLDRLKGEVAKAAQARADRLATDLADDKKLFQEKVEIRKLGEQAEG